MGAITSRQHAGVEEVDVGAHHAYRYPPRSGNYFGSHFIMGGERFDTPQPESYLFGENTDLNFLGSRPVPFPYPPPQPNEPTKALRCLVNIRKESLRFVKTSAEYQAECGDGNVNTNQLFNVEFTFDCDVWCAITIYCMAVEEMTPNGVVYTSKFPKYTSKTYNYKKGAGHHFSQPLYVFDPSLFNEDDLIYDMDKEVIPVVIHCVADAGPDEIRQSHSTYAIVDKLLDGTFALKALKQKLFVDGLSYLLQEIYGIENKNNDKQNADDDIEDNGSECVICMCDVRDTLILPCRHLCLCNSCASSLRYQANNCPICRAPFRALLQIRALQKSGNAVASINFPDGTCENIPSGYEAVSLIEALNGPCVLRAPAATMPDLVETPENETSIQAAQTLNRSISSSNNCKNVSEYDMALITRNDENKYPLLTMDKKSKGVKEQKSEEIMDEDSEAEKLSPLLKTNGASHIALNIDDVVMAIDGTEGNDSKKDEDKNDDEYYLAKDAYDNDPECQISSVESTPQRLPGTPMSHASGMSSQDSCSSTRHLLNKVPADRTVNI